MPEFRLKGSYFSPANLLTALRAPGSTYLKLACDGLLNPRVYQRLATLVRTLPDLPFVDIGAAGGAGTIALARGYERSGKVSPVLAVERCEGGSRSVYGGYDDNLERLSANLDRFGVRSRVVIHPHSLAAPLSPSLDHDALAGFLSDADGRLDRDFALFWDRVVPGGLIVVDDYPRRRPRPGLAARKEMLTFELLNVLRASGHFVPFQRIGATVFGRKPSTPTDDLPRAWLEESRRRVDARWREPAVR